MEVIGNQKCLVCLKITLQYVFFCVSQRKESHIGLERHEAK